MNERRPWQDRVELLSINGMWDVYELKHSATSIRQLWTDSHFLWVPAMEKDQELLCMCLQRALMFGQNKVKEGKWNGFNISLDWGKEAEQDLWPHVRLTPGNYP